VVCQLPQYPVTWLSVSAGTAGFSPAQACSALKAARLSPHSTSQSSSTISKPVADKHGHACCLLCHTGPVPQPPRPTPHLGAQEPHLCAHRCTPEGLSLRQQDMMHSCAGEMIKHMCRHSDKHRHGRCACGWAPNASSHSSGYNSPTRASYGTSQTTGSSTGTRKPLVAVDKVLSPRHLVDSFARNDSCTQ
jgi:hypothetical protein